MWLSFVSLLCHSLAAPTLLDNPPINVYKVSTEGDMWKMCGFVMCNSLIKGQALNMLVAQQSVPLFV